MVVGDQLPQVDHGLPHRVPVGICVLVHESHRPPSSRPVHLRIRSQLIDGNHAAGEHHEGGHLPWRVDNGLTSSSSRGLVHKPASTHSLSTVFSVHPATASKNRVAKNPGLVHIKAAFECGNLVFFFSPLFFWGGLFGLWHMFL